MIPPFLIPFVWFLLGLILMASEFVIPGFVIFFFGMGALASGIFTSIFPFLRSSVVWQVPIWLGASGLSLVVLRKYFSKIFKGRFRGKERETEFAGRKVQVIEDIKPEMPGRVRFQGTSWKAVSDTESFEKGQEVEILKLEDLAFVVTKSILNDRKNEIERK